MTTASDQQAFDPESVMNAAPLGQELSSEERAFLARAKGRQWEPIDAGELSAYLAYEPQHVKHAYLWSPSMGVTALREANARATELRDSSGGTIIIAIDDVGEAGSLAALRESQIVLPAYSTSMANLRRLLGPSVGAGQWYRSATQAGGVPQVM